MQDRSTDFEFLPIDVSLGRCQRYFYQIQGNVDSNTSLGIGFCNSTTAAFSHLKFATTMRSIPSISGSGYQATDFNSYAINGNVITLNNACNIHADVVVTVASGLTIFRGNSNMLTNSTASYVALSSEL